MQAEAIGPSLRGRLVRLLIKHLVGPKFHRAAGSVAKYRELDGWVIKNQRPPAGTRIQSVRAGETEAEWVIAAGVETDRACLFLHGGAFIMGSPATHRELAAHLSAATEAAMLVIDYRLAPEHPFPAALDDAVAAYRWMLDQGFAARRVFIGGDSAGGGLALQTLLALRDRGDPRPAAAVLLSPQTDWLRIDGESYRTRAAVDPLNTLDMCRFSAAQYVGGNDPAAPLLSPVNMDLSGLPPLCVHVGDCEVLLSDSVRLAERARAAGGEVELKVWPGMWHVFQNSARLVPDARRSLERIGEFVRAHAEPGAMGSRAGAP